MLCSKCSEIIRPVVAVDIDGTLGDYHGHFIDFAEKYVGRELHRNYIGGQSFRLWFQTANLIDKEQYRTIKLAYRQGGLKRSMPVFDGAQELLFTILSHDVELWLTTTRPYLSLDTVIPDTVWWLAQNGMSDYDGMLFDADKYAKLLDRVDESRIVAIIDDLPDMCEEADRLVGRNVSIMMGTRWNEAVWNGRRSTMWSIIAGIGDIIESWKENNAQDFGFHNGASAGSGQGQLDLLGEVES
jgi:phosphoglycolate phosphatase-like HAD superfamily hydrolase